jgi:cell division protein FtsA
MRFGHAAAHSGPAFSTLVGLIRYAASERIDLNKGYDLHSGQLMSSSANLIDRIKRAIRENF